MTNFIKTQNSFAYGEISPEFFTRDDIVGLSKLENMDVLPGGGLKRRKGLKTVVNIDSDARLIPFCVEKAEQYILVITHNRLRIYQDDTLVSDVVAPWNVADVSTLQYAQRFGTIVFVHPKYRPYILKKTSSGFNLLQFNFASDANGILTMPKTKFDDAQGVTITLSSSAQGNIYATFTTNIDFWTSENVGTYIFLMNKQWLITEYISPTQVTALLGETYTVPGSPIDDWTEGVFSTYRGWPCSISFHQDRLVFGGSPHMPSSVWMSCVGRHNDFDTGTGLDDEAIYLTLLSQEKQEICTIVSSDNLQVLTTKGVWAISSKPLTPSNINIKQHTSVGTVSGKSLVPQQIEGKTVFVSSNQQDIRELALDNLNEVYNANDLCAFSKHLLGNAVDMAYNENTKQLFVVLSDGTMSVLNQNSVLGISAWAKYTTSGQFKSIIVLGNDTYVIVKRDAQYNIEKFSSDCMTDGSDYGFEYRAHSLPLRANGHETKKLRIRKIIARVMDTKSICINDNRMTLPNEIYENDSDGFTGDVSLNVLGTLPNYTAPLWRIHGTESLPITVLSVTIYGRYSI